MTRKIPLYLIMTVIISWAAILFPCDRCFCQSEQLSDWDSDGGFETDYSGIPRLEWTGPGSPGIHGFGAE